MLTGAGGIGKTQLLVQALSVAETGRPILWIDVEAHRTSVDVVSMLRTLLGTDGVACSENDVPSQLDAIQACVVFDGVERATLGDFDAFEEFLNSLYKATLFAQFVVTSQIYLHSVEVDTRMKVGALAEDASQKLLDNFKAIEDVPKNDDCSALLKFCDGHALTLRLAAALREHYGGANQALEAINAKGAAIISVPGRRSQNVRTSLVLCLQTAYDALPDDARKLLWALSEAPAGILTKYLEGGWLEPVDTSESLGDLRRWNLVELIVAHGGVPRAQVLSPIRLFATEAARKGDESEYLAVIDKLAHAIEMMVAVWEIKYDDPYETPYIVSRYEEELPNLLHLLVLARRNRSDASLGLTAISVARAMMRYFFVRGLNEQGASTMREAAELALSIGKSERASGLVLQLVALAHRGRNAELMRVGLSLAQEFGEEISDLQVGGDIALCRAMAAHDLGDNLGAEKQARTALKAYQSQLRATISELQLNPDEEDRLQFAIDERHNDISQALGILGFALLAQGNYEEAKRVYEHSLEHGRGASVAVNRGQTLHQIGNCESHLGRFREAANLYVEAAGIFNFVGMEEYLSNAIGELGYALIDLNEDYPLDGSTVDIIGAALSDLEKSIRRVFNAERPIDHSLALGVIRKTFGCIALVSLAKQGALLEEFCMALAEDLLVPLQKQIQEGTREAGELFPLAMMEVALRLGFYAAVAEREFPEQTDSPPEVIGEMLKAVCNAHEWAQNAMRTVDWLAALLTHRWKCQGAGRDRLRDFVKNYNDDVVDWLDIVSNRSGS
jgi:tetratricopeptide (TPR) repeat protein